MSLEPDLVDIIKAALESRIGDMYTTDVGIVQSYDPTTRTVDVQIVTPRCVASDDEGTLVADDEAVRANVPVCFPRGGGFSIEWPLQKGDSVVLLTLTRTATPWRLTGQPAQSTLVDQGMHHPGNSVAIPSLKPDVVLAAGAPASITATVLSAAAAGAVLGDLQISAAHDLEVSAGRDASVTATRNLTLDGLHIMLGAAATSFAADAAKVDAELTKIATAISGLGGAYARLPVACTKVKVE